MNDMAKSARAAMKAKAKKLTTDPHEKVDSSTWTPPEPLETEVKTGLRPISRRQFKAGGKVGGNKARTHAGHKPRKSGGKAISANSLINRDVREANELREGIKHVGGFKRGGKIKREHHADGNPAGDEIGNLIRNMPQEAPDREAMSRKVRDIQTDAALRNKDGNIPTPPMRPQPKESNRITMPTMKKGGRAKKFLGGPMMQPGTMMSSAPSMNVANTQGMPQGMPGQDPRQNIVSKDRLNFGMGTQGNPYKKGGKVAHPDEAADKQLIKKMVKSSAMKREEHCWGGEAGGKKRKEGGGVFSGPSYPGKVPGVVPGGRMARKSGGKAMTVNVIVAGKEKPAGMTPPAGMMPTGGPPPGARPPVSVPPPQPLAPAAGAPAPMQAPMPQQPPMGRKHGGRTFHSYKDMTAGSASGEGRLEKSDIAAYKKRK
jgi:hypothetical protein